MAASSSVGAGPETTAFLPLSCPIASLTALCSPGSQGSLSDSQSSPEVELAVLEWRGLPVREAFKLKIHDRDTIERIRTLNGRGRRGVEGEPGGWCGIEQWLSDCVPWNLNPSM